MSGLVPIGTKVLIGPYAGTVKGVAVHGGKSYYVIAVDAGPPEPPAELHRDDRKADEMGRVRG